MRTKAQTIRQIVLEAGIPLKGLAGSLNPAWKGGRCMDDDGYVLVYRPDHPNRSSQNNVREHRLVMEGILGRILKPEEVVHHRNGVVSDNRPDNLELFADNAAHLAATLAGKCPKWSEEGRARILATVRSRRKQVDTLPVSELGETVSP